MMATELASLIATHGFSAVLSAMSSVADRNANSGCQGWAQREFRKLSESLSDLAADVDVRHLPRVSLEQAGY